MDDQFCRNKQDEQFKEKPTALQVVEIVEKTATDNKNEPEKVTWKDVYPQILCSLMSFLFNLHVGIYLIYANLLLQYLDTSTATYMVSLGAMSTALGVVISGPFADKFGRKNAHIFMGIPCIASWAIFAVSDINEVELLLIARLLGGLTTGLTIAALVYVAEIAHKDFRAMLLSSSSAFGGFGSVFIALLSTFVNWKEAAFVFTCIFILVTLAIAVYMPETPFWLLNFDGYKETQARRNLEKLNPNQYILEDEWSMLKKNYHKSVELAAKKKNLSRCKFLDATIYKPICLLIGLLSLQQLTGSFVTLYYFKNIVPLISPTIFNKFDDEIFIIFGVIRFTSNVIGSAMAKKIGRRVLLIMSASGMAVPSFLLAFFLTKYIAFEYQEQLCLALFLCYIFSTGIGVLIIPWTVSPELLPPLLKGTGSSFMIGYSYLVSSVYSQPLPYMMNETGIIYVFIIFGHCCLAIIVYTYFFLPETLGKNIHEINQLFQKKTNSPSDMQQQSTSSP